VTSTSGGQGFPVSRIGRGGDRATSHLVVVSGQPITCSRRLARGGVCQVAVFRSSTLCQVLAQRRLTGGCDAKGKTRPETSQDRTQACRPEEEGAEAPRTRPRLSRQAAGSPIRPRPAWLGSVPARPSGETGSALIVGGRASAMQRHRATQEIPELAAGEQKRGAGLGHAAIGLLLTRHRRPPLLADIFASLPRALVLDVDRAPARSSVPCKIGETEPVDVVGVVAAAAPARHADQAWASPHSVCNQGSHDG
jgi:hypothetical protein